MTLAERAPVIRDRTTVHLVDCDVHQDLSDWSELRPYLDPAWWDRIAVGGPAFGSRSYMSVRGHILSEDMINPSTGKPADDPEWVRRLLFDTYGVDVGILTSDILSLRPISTDRPLLAWLGHELGHGCRRRPGSVGCQRDTTCQ